MEPPAKLPNSIKHGRRGGEAYRAYYKRAYGARVRSLSHFLSNVMPTYGTRFVTKWVSEIL